ncbi:MAG: OmpA family protein, partial [Myxococcota bacterium]|nr:OmpA family protein [Myxococcota bacterium]
DATAASPAPPPDAHPTDEPDEDIPRPVEEADPPDQSELTFAAGSTALGADAQAAVARMAQRASDGGVVHVYGHADDAGTEWANHDLSLDRAGRVARALRGAGLPPGRIRVHGAGDQYPLGPVGSRRNRRVELALQDDVP